VEFTSEKDRVLECDDGHDVSDGSKHDEHRRRVFKPAFHCVILPVRFLACGHILITKSRVVSESILLNSLDENKNYLLENNKSKMKIDHNQKLHYIG